MGVSPMGSSSFGRGYETPNPNPKNFRVVQHEYIGTWLIVIVNYPDCKNYEGDKLLVYKGVELKKLVEGGSIDPHFSASPMSPIARFRPTPLGVVMARKLIASECTL